MSFSVPTVVTMCSVPHVMGCDEDSAARSSRSFSLGDHPGMAWPPEDVSWARLSGGREDRDSTLQGVEINRLAQVHVEAGFHRAVPVGLRAVPGDGYQKDTL